MVKKKLNFAALAVVLGIYGCAQNEGVSNVKITSNNLEQIKQGLNNGICDSKAQKFAHHIANEIREDYLYSMLIDDDNARDMMNRVNDLSLDKTIEFISVLSENLKSAYYDYTSGYYKTSSCSSHDIFTSEFFESSLLAAEGGEGGEEKRGSFEQLKNLYETKYQKVEEERFVENDLKSENTLLRSRNDEVMIENEQLTHEVNCLKEREGESSSLLEEKETEISKLRRDLESSKDTLKLYRDVLVKNEKAIKKLSTLAGLVQKENEVEMTNLFSMLEGLESSQVEKESYLSSSKY